LVWDDREKKYMNKDYTKEKISVIIPTVNAADELDLAIASIKKNSDCEIEFVIVIDPDMNTGKVNKDILNVCKKHAVKAWINKENLGPYGNWNNRLADICYRRPVLCPALGLELAQVLGAQTPHCR